VPEPQKKSATISPALEEARIILSRSLSGFCVSKSRYSDVSETAALPVTFGISIHQSKGFLPSSK
jgi:hypothetical protein